MICRVNDVKKSYAGRLVLDIGKLEFVPGKIYAVLGPNGSGKSTLLKLVAGIEYADTGEIEFEWNKTNINENIAYMAQKPYIFDMTVLQNVMMGLPKHCDSYKKAAAAIEVTGMKAYINSRAVKLSGGESQRIAVARTIVLQRKLVLLDEPASAADVQSIRLVEECIKNVVRTTGCTVVFSTHNPSQAMRIADEALLLINGRVVDRGDPSRVLTCPEHAEAKEFLQFAHL